MKTEYKRDLKNNYLVAEAGTDLQMEEYILHMTEKNEIAGLLSMQLRKTDGVCRLYYNITSRRSLDEVYKNRTVSYQDMFHIFSEMQNAIESARRYLLNPQRLVFNPRFIFLQTENLQIEFCYFPEEENSSVASLAEYLLKKLDHEDARAVSVGYHFYQRATEDNFSLPETLREILEENSREKKHQNPEMESREQEDRTGHADPGRYETSGQAAYERRTGAEWERDSAFRDEKGTQESAAKRFGEAFHPALLCIIVAATAAEGALWYFGFLAPGQAGGIFFLVLAAVIWLNRFLKKRRDQKKERGLGKRDEEDPYARERLQEKMEALERELYTSKEEMSCTKQRYFSRQQPARDRTECLAECEDVPSEILLVSDQPDLHPDIRLQRRTLIIGKQQGQADVLLRADVVSRIHARLEQRRDGCFVRDLNSKNGTFVNGIRLRPQEEREIRPGDEVVFANIRYRVEKEQKGDGQTQFLH